MFGMIKNLNNSKINLSSMYKFLLAILWCVCAYILYVCIVYLNNTKGLLAFAAFLPIYAFFIYSLGKTFAVDSIVKINILCSYLFFLFFAIVMMYLWRIAAYCPVPTIDLEGFKTCQEKVVASVNALFNYTCFVIIYFTLSASYYILFFNKIRKENGEMKKRIYLLVFIMILLLAILSFFLEYVVIFLQEV